MRNRPDFYHALASGDCRRLNNQILANADSHDVLATALRRPAARNVDWNDAEMKMARFPEDVNFAAMPAEFKAGKLESNKNDNLYSSYNGSRQKTKIVRNQNNLAKP